jgi:hypothetical protein
MVGIAEGTTLYMTTGVHDRFVSQWV